MGRTLRWELWLAMWRSWTSTATWREKAAAALVEKSRDGVGAVAGRVSAVADHVSQVVRLERMLAADGDVGRRAGGEEGLEGEGN